jgi:sec-independent protein translocase protein TatB
MFDFGFSEIVLTSAIALVVLGPERLPKVARQVGNWMGRARVMARQLTEQLEREVNADELLKQRAKTAPPPQAAATYPSPLPPDHFPPDPAAPTPTPAPVAVAPPDAAPLPPEAVAPTPAASPVEALSPADVTPVVVRPPRTPHPNSPEMMHARERAALEQPAPATDQAIPATRHKPGDE